MDLGCWYFGTGEAKMTFDDLKALVKLTFQKPEIAAKTLMATGWPSSARWMGLLLAVSVSALLAWFSTQLLPVPVGGGMDPLTTMVSQPLVLAGIQFVAISMAAGLMAIVGQIFNGKGSFDDALLLTVWIEVVLLLVQAVQIAVMLIFPPISGILGIIAIALFFWLTVHFTKALHGFKSGVKVLLGIIATGFVLGILLSIVISTLGLMPPMPEMAQ